MEKTSEEGRENGGENDTKDTKEEKNNQAAENGDTPQTAADSPSELEENKEIEEPSIKTPDALTAQPINRNKMGGSTSNGTQEPLPCSGYGKTDEEESGEPQIADHSTAPRAVSGKTDEEESGECQIADLSTAPLEGSGKTGDEERGELQIDDPPTAPHEGSGKTDEEESREPQMADLSTAPREGFGKTDDGESGKPQIADLSTAPPEGSGKTDEGESGEPQIADHSTAPHKGSGKTDEEGSGEPQIADHSIAPREGSGKTDEEESGEPQITNSYSEPKETKQKTVVPGAGLDPHVEVAPREGSGKTDEEERGEPQKTDSSSEPKETKPKTEHRDPTMDPPTPGRNSESKEPKDKEGPLTRERMDQVESEEEKRATEIRANEQKVSMEGVDATDGGTKQDGTTKQKVNEERVEAGSTEHPPEDAEEPFEHVSKEYPVSISVCTSAYDFNVQGLVSFLKDLMKDHRELIKEVKVHALPYNGLDHYKFPEENPVDVMLLCHSITNRGFAITDVMDALYDEYLPYCQSDIGKNKMGVIVHDFDDMRETVQSSRIGSFKYKQPKAFKTTSLQITCGHIATKEQVFKQMQKADREKLLEFLKNASKVPEVMMKQVTKRQGFSKKAKDMIVTFGNKVASSFNSIVESLKAGGRSQDSTSEGSSVDPSETDRNDHGTIRNTKAQDDQTKRLANERQPSSQQAKRTCLPEKSTSGGSHQTPKASMDERNLNPPSEASVIGQPRPGTSIAAAATDTQGSPGQQSTVQFSEWFVTIARNRSDTTPPPRRISVSVCSSANEHNVKGFMSKLNELQTGQPHMIDNVRFRSLPYNDIDSFRFPSNDPVDVMVLCHSVQNRGFSITNVLNSLYEKYLQYCHDVIGKENLAVIVHDFSDCKPKTLDARMESFRRSQPLTFELVDTVIVCGSLEVPGKIEMREEDMTRLANILRNSTI